MTWGWSHTEEAYKNALRNLRGLDRATLHEIYGEIKTHMECSDAFNVETYNKAIEEAKSLPVDAIVAEIWGFSKTQSACDNGGFNAWVCPFGCHTVSFSGGDE